MHKPREKHGKENPQRCCPPGVKLLSAKTVRSNDGVCVQFREREFNAIIVKYHCAN